jgi:2-hydroxyglutarate dehydrogenase
VCVSLFSVHLGVADYSAFAHHYAKEIEDTGRGRIQLQYEVRSIKLIQKEKGKNQVVEIQGCEPLQAGPTKVVHAKNVITCAGLQADRVAQLADGAPKPQVLTFRGTYYQMKPEFRDICTMNIYPVPSGGGIPVGVHFTPTVNQRRGRQCIVGPGACMAFHREGYSFFDMTFQDVWNMATHIGLWKFAFGNFDLAITEMYRDLNKKAFLDQARRLIPTVTDDMVESSFSGVMAQVFLDDGSAAKDFILERQKLNGTTLNVRSAPTPACTASLAIAQEVVQMAAEDFGWGEGKKRKKEDSPFYD